MNKITDNKFQLQEFEVNDYIFHFKIQERVKDFKVMVGDKALNMMNGESVFGPSETWPAQLQDFGHFIAEETKKGNILVNQSTFSKDNLVDLLQKYKPSLFGRTYVSKEEVKHSFEKVIQYLEVGVMVGVLEKEIRDEFNQLSSMKKSFYRTFKSAGRKHIDTICSSNNIDKTITYIAEMLPDYAPLTVLKYESLR